MSVPLFPFGTAASARLYAPCSTPQPGSVWQSIPVVLRAIQLLPPSVVFQMPLLISTVPLTSMYQTYISFRPGTTANSPRTIGQFVEFVNAGQLVALFKPNPALSGCFARRVQLTPLVDE